MTRNAVHVTTCTLVKNACNNVSRVYPYEISRMGMYTNTSVCVKYNSVCAKMCYGLNWDWHARWYTCKNVRGVYVSIRMNGNV